MTSIIIISFNGEKKLPRLLRSLNALPAGEIEVILVNDGSNDRTSEVPFTLDLNYKFRVINQENKGRAEAKNRGAGESTYDRLWFLDDDMKVQKETYEAHMRHLDEHPGTVSVGTTDEDPEFVKTDIQRYRLGITEKWKTIIENIPNPLPVDHLFITAANFCMEKVLFMQLGCFDARLKDGEDLDFAYRVYEAAVPIYYNKYAKGFHWDSITCLSYIRRNRQYAEGYRKLLEIKPHYYFINKRMHFSKPAGLKRVLLSVLSRPSFAWLIDHFNVFVLFPRKLRYRFYEILIFGLGITFVHRKIAVA